MTDLPAAELTSPASDVNSSTKRRQGLLWIVGSTILIIALLVYLYTVISPPQKGSSKGDISRRQATVSAAASPVTDNPSETLAGQVRDAKRDADIAKAQQVSTQEQLAVANQKIAGAAAEQQRAVAAAQRQALETRALSNAAGPGVDGGASGAAAGLARDPAAAPNLRRGGLRNPFAPISGPLAESANSVSGGASGGTAGDVEAAPVHRIMTVISASNAAEGGRGGDGRGGSSSPLSRLGGSGGSGQGGQGGLSGSSGVAAPKSYFTSKLETFETSKFVPPNAYATATVLVGVDAATGTTFSADPKPVLFRIKGPAIHVGEQGRFQTTDLSGCMVNGAAFGELPSEKVYIKLQKITCPAGPEHFSVATVEGYVSFKGKAGVRGTVISREGQFTSKAAIAGALNGLGQAMSTNVQRSVAGTVTGAGSNSLLSTKELTPEQIATASVGSGVSGAATMLADYYIKRAEQYQPVIEMPTGIQVELVFLNGFQIR